MLCNWPASKGLDLIEIAANATPPVCRIVDYGKFMYEEAKRSKDSHQPANRMKELQISPTIDPHDLGVKRDHAIQFLCDDMKSGSSCGFAGGKRRTRKSVLR
jgi:translation initiation factor IF-3